MIAQSFETKIRDLIATNATEEILSIINQFKLERDRAEQKVLAYEHHIKVLAAHANEIIAPMLEKENLGSPLQNCTKPFTRTDYPEKPKPVKPPKSSKPIPAPVNLSNLI